MSDFSSDMTDVIRQAQRHAKAWLGALQYATYSAPEKPRHVRMASEDGMEARRVRAHVQASADSWFEQTRLSVEGELKRAESALAMEWEKRRDPRHSSPAAREAFALAFEANVEGVAEAIIKAERDLEAGVVRHNSGTRQGLKILREDLNHMIGIYDQHVGGDNLRRARELVDGPPEQGFGFAGRRF